MEEFLSKNPFYEMKPEEHLLMDQYLEIIKQ